MVAEDFPAEDVTLCGCFNISGEAVKGLKQMFSLGLLKDPIFIMFVVSNFLTSIGFNVPYVYTVVSGPKNSKLCEKFDR